MPQLLALLAASWLLLWLFEKESLSPLGLTPTPTRLQYALLLFLASAGCAATTFVLRTLIAKETYTLSPNLTPQNVLLECWYQFRTVLTEELLCRGALLYILIKKISPQKGIVLSSMAFAVLHWLNAGVWGNLPQMALVFAFTFAMGLLLAYAYARTLSLWIPFAIHYGWNLTQNYVFPETASGNHLFTLAAPPPSVTISYLAFFALLFLPKLAVLVMDYFIVKNMQQVKPINALP